MTPEQVKAATLGMRDELLGVATRRIAPLQDAIDLGEDTPADVENLKLWKQYRVALSRIDQQQGFPGAVAWPAAPN
ncbi:tail fiber assembly protein [Pseudomonas veronii]|uniref:Tail fiber assembly protein n=2 Tax=Pseudomonas veronii TaxID=76761 RepID=A0A5M8F7P6_PSEVE|nr:tail fiber assembly protein [Pseudomonas veronii]KAA6180858.1 tail fiber assembly protein [Pseudomonas veronii]